MIITYHLLPPALISPNDAAKISGCSPFKIRGAIDRIVADEASPYRHSVVKHKMNQRTRYQLTRRLAEMIRDGLIKFKL